MFQTTGRLLRFFIVFYMLCYFLGLPVWAQNIRNSIYAGSFYPTNSNELVRQIKTLTKKAENTPVKIPPKKVLRALILPHAGYIYSGFTAAHAVHVLDKKLFSKVILMGPDHHVGFDHAAVSNAEAFKTPLGLVPLHQEAKTLLKNSLLFKIEPLSDRKEHSLEVLLPFLQWYLEEFSIIPIIMGPGDINAYAQAVESITDHQTLVVASSDLSHYLPYDTAVATDKSTIDMILRLNLKDFEKYHDRACGRIPVLVLMRLAEKHGWQPVLLHYSNSGDTAGSRDKVVGYTAIAFYGDHLMKNKNDLNHHLSEEQGQLLVKLARRTIEKQLYRRFNDSDALEKALLSNQFQQHQGTFVTLNKQGQLRGCIGSLEGNEPIAEGVRHNAVNAAFHDPRFPPLSADELDHVDIEISILTEPKSLAYRDGDDLISKLRVNIDGVILRKGYQSATFLPQVWDQLPNPRNFLSHLCRKAGLASDAWETSKLQISTYQVIHFKEK